MNTGSPPAFFSRYSFNSNERRTFVQMHEKWKRNDIKQKKLHITGLKSLKQFAFALVTQKFKQLREKKSGYNRKYFHAYRHVMEF